MSRDGSDPLTTLNPYVFVTGCTRSGTTLLQRMLDHHRELAVSNDTHLVPRSLFGQRPTADLPMDADLFADVTGFKRFPKLGVDVETALRLASVSDTFAGFVSGLLDEFARRQGKVRAGEKDPEYVRRLPLLHVLFPGARIVHIIRDGRDVALSSLDWVTPERFLGRLSLWQEEPVAVCALWWRRQVLAGLRGGAILGPELSREVRYEDLVRDPERALRDLSLFLNLPFDTAMLDYHQGRTRPDAGLGSKKRWLPPTGGLRDWRIGLCARDLQLFEALAGDVLASLGYALATGPAIPDEVAAVAGACIRRWEAEVGPTVVHGGVDASSSRPDPGRGAT